MKHSKSLFRAAAATLVLVLSACGLPAGNENSAAPRTVTVTSTEGIPMEVNTDEGTNLSIEPDSVGEECTHPDLTVEESNIGHWVTANSFPTSNPNFKFIPHHYVDDHFDPCAELSWVTFVGSNNQGSAVLTALVLFHYGQALPDQKPFEFDEITAERLSDGEVLVTYGHAGAESWKGPSARYPVSYTVQGGELVGGEEFEALELSGVALDLSSAGMAF